MSNQIIAAARAFELAQTKAAQKKDSAAPAVIVCEENFEQALKYVQNKVTSSRTWTKRYLFSIARLRGVSEFLAADADTREFYRHPRRIAAVEAAGRTLDIADAAVPASELLASAGNAGTLTLPANRPRAAAFSADIS